MPLIDLTLPQGSISPDDRAKLADELTAVVLRAERAPDTDFFRSVTWAFVHELPEGTITAGGAEPAFRVVVTMPEGALSDRRKQELVSEATRLVSRGRRAGRGGRPSRVRADLRGGRGQLGRRPAT